MFSDSTAIPLVIVAGLGTVTDRSPTNSESNFNWSVASPKLVDDLSDGTILLRDQCAIKYVT